MEDLRPVMFCLPHAGGSGVVFHSWKQGLALPVRVQPVDLPGHGTRRGEPLLTSVDEIVADLAARLRGLVSGPYLLFGHSFGALIAFELAHALRDSTGDPVALLVSGRNGPAVPHPAPPLHDLPSQQLLERLDELDGIPPLLRSEPELIDLFLPPLRADVRMAETYVRGTHGRLHCPVHAVAGDIDPLADGRGLARWAEETTGDCVATTLPGGHMVLDEPEFADWLRQTLEKITASR